MGKYYDCPFQLFSDTWANPLVTFQNQLHVVHTTPRAVQGGGVDE